MEVGHPRLHEGGGVGLDISGVAEAEEVEEVGGEAGEAGTLHVTSWKHTVICLFCFLTLKMFPCSTILELF